MKHNKKSDQWWAVYRAVFRALHNRDSDGFEFSPSASKAADAAFNELKINSYANSSSIPEKKP